MVIADETGIMTLVNAQTEELFGYNRDELLGEPVEMLIPDRYRRRHVVHRGNYNEEPRVRPMGAGMEAETRRLNQVFINLLSNVLKYTREQAKVVITIGGTRKRTSGLLCRG